MKRYFCKCNLKKVSTDQPHSFILSHLFECPQKIARMQASRVFVYNFHFPPLFLNCVIWPERNMAGFLRGVLVRLRSSLLHVFWNIQKWKNHCSGSCFRRTSRYIEISTMYLTLAFRSCGHVFQFSLRVSFHPGAKLPYNTLLKWIRLNNTCVLVSLWNHG